MSFIGATLDSVTIDATKKILTLAGKNFGEAQSPAADIACRLHGSGNPFVSVDSVTSWANLLATGSYLVTLPGGIYDCWITTSDDNLVTLESAFTVPGGAVFFFFNHEPEFERS